MLWYFDSVGMPGASGEAYVGLNGNGYLFSYDEDNPPSSVKHDWTRVGPSHGDGNLLHGKVDCPISVDTTSYGRKSVTHFQGWYTSFTPEEAIRLGREDWYYAGWVGNTFYYHEARKTDNYWEFDIFKNIENTVLDQKPDSFHLAGRGWYYIFRVHQVCYWGSVGRYYTGCQVGDLTPPPFSPLDAPKGQLYTETDVNWTMDPYHQVSEVHVGDALFEYPYGMDDFGRFVIESDIWPSYGFFPSLASHAYQLAIKHLPSAECNTIANILDVVGTLKSLMRGYVKPHGVLQSLSDMWLRYRYQYNTTVSDIREYQALAERLVCLAGQPSITTYGYTASAGVECRSTVVLSMDEVLPSDALHQLQTWGLKLNAVNTWDLVPYSFIVDWFLHISDMLECMERFGESISYHPIKVTTTFKAVTSNSLGAVQESFLRILGRPPLRVHYDYLEASNKTLLARIIDSGALILGGK